MKLTINNSFKQGVNILIPMSGAGSRFVKAGHTAPKPLIKVKGKTMIEWAMKSFNFLNNIPRYRIIFIIRRSDIDNYKIDKTLKSLFGKEIILVVKDSNEVKGQAYDCILARNYIDTQNPLFIYNCDTYSLSNVWDVVLKWDPDGVIPYFKSNNPRYSFIKIDEKGNIIQTTEKVPISMMASSGMYYFKMGHDFCEAAEEMISENESYNKEYYVIPTYNRLIKKGKIVKPAKATLNWILGTPEEMERFIQFYKR